MVAKKNLKYVLGISVVLIVIAGAGVAIGRAVKRNNTKDDEPKPMEQIMAEMRQTMVERSLNAYIIQPVDAHQSEYVSVHDRRRAYVTGFTGSAGTAVIAESQAAIWTDSRYFLQAERELDANFWTLMKQGQPGVPSIDDWLLQTLEPSSKVGTDPMLISAAEFDRLSRVLAARGHELVGVAGNLVDLVWNNRPEFVYSRLEPFNITYSGKLSSAKINQVRDEIRRMNSDALVITTLDEIAWLFNLRASDVKNNPVFYAYALLTLNDVYLFVNEGRMTPEVEEHFAAENLQNVHVLDYDKIIEELQTLISSIAGRVLVASSSSHAVISAIPATKLYQTINHISNMKCIKNDVEAAGMRLSHIRDGVAVVRYLHWLENHVDTEVVTELSGGEVLSGFRSEQINYKSLSFTPISSVGPNAAINHYSPTPETDLQITRDDIYLIDSGGQYLEGTTDVTRTVYMNANIPPKIKETFTRVLKGFLSLGHAVFPPSTSFTAFDAFARKSLWDVGLDYGHGTGHGIGHFLGVHEYPPSISSGNAGNILRTTVNMFTSNEPGYYEDGEFGIRLEDIVQVVNAEGVKYDFNGRGAQTFYSITVVPIQTTLIDTDLMTVEEIGQLNRYHERVRQLVGEVLLEQGHSDVHAWLVAATQPIVSTFKYN